MKTYTVTLYGNRRGALINADYMVIETTDYISAKTRIKANGGWGFIGQQSSFERAIAYNDEFIKEVSKQGLNIKRGFIAIK